MSAHRNDASAMITLAAATAAALLGGRALAGTNGPANPGDPTPLTISLSGSTAMRNFTVGPDITSLTPGTSITLNGTTYFAGTAKTTAVQLAAGNANSAAPIIASSATAPLPSASYLALRLEWHEQGSVEGIAELANDQIGPIVSVDPASRNPTNPVGGIGNRVYVNGNIFTGATTVNGFTLNSSTYNTYANYNAAGTNTQGGQNRVQIGISDVQASQGFSVAGAAAFNRTPGTAGYGKGNPALIGVSGTNLLGLGNASVRRGLIDQTSLNMDATKVNPSTGTTYAPNKPWNTAALGNTDSEIVASTATTISANPGTGLTDLNKSDARWLQSTGRLANGANFNVVTRDNNSGTLNVASLNVGLDPSYTVGENDNGNGLDTSVDQTAIGANLRFQGKSSGGQLRQTVQNSRMAIGHLSLNDAKSGNAAGTLANANVGAQPLRALGIRNSDDNTATPVQPSFDTLSNETYLLTQNENYVTIKDPANGDAAIAAFRTANPGTSLNDVQIWSGLKDTATGIKGDSAGKEVAAFRQNIFNSSAAFPTDSGVLNPASGLLKNGFIPPKYMSQIKDVDGQAPHANATFDSTNFSDVRDAYGSFFEVGAAAGVTTGTGAVYGNDATANIPINANNYLFGDFNGDGKRDFQDIKYAVAGQTTLNAAGVGVNWKAGIANATAAYTVGTGAAAKTFTKGDLIVKGDFNSDGNFDGRDLYEMARGTSLADAGLTLTGASDPDAAQLTSASGVSVSNRYRAGQLYKNAALDYLQANASAAQKQQASASTSADPSGTNAFNKFDINRDGSVSRQDAAIVDGFVGKDYRNLNDQLGAVVATNVNAAGTVFKGDPTVDQTTPRKSISLVDVELNDNGLITNTLDAGGNSDFKLIRQALGSSLLDGDTDFSGVVNFTDLSTLLNNYNLPGKWSTGDSDFSGTVGFTDLSLLLNTYNPTASPSIFLSSLRLDPQAVNLLVADGFNVVVPEPGLATVAAAGFVATGLRRRRVRPA